MPRRARYPDHDGYVERDGVHVFYEVYGRGEETVFFLPAWSIVHSRIWKAQIPYFARHYRVLVHDPRPPQPRSHDPPLRRRPPERTVRVLSDRPRSRYDLWIADEGWEVDYYLHEHPQLKRAPFAWLTDFVGFLPMDDADDRDRYLTADYNAEMVDHVAAHPDVRDRAIFVGNPEDVIPGWLDADLPGIRDWTEQHFDFAGYVMGFDPARVADRVGLRAELGYGPDEQVCVVTVGARASASIYCAG